MTFTDWVSRVVKITVGLHLTMWICTIVEPGLMIFVPVLLALGYLYVPVWLRSAREELELRRFRREIQGELRETA